MPTAVTGQIAERASDDHDAYGHDGQSGDQPPRRHRLEAGETCLARIVGVIQHRNAGPYRPVVGRGVTAEEAHVGLTDVELDDRRIDLLVAPAQAHVVDDVAGGPIRPCVPPVGANDRTQSANEEKCPGYQSRQLKPSRTVGGLAAGSLKLDEQQTGCQHRRNDNSTAPGSAGEVGGAPGGGGPMPDSQSVPRRRNSAYDRIVRRVDRRISPMVVSVLYVVLGVAYCFAWGPVVRHIPSLWIRPADLGTTYNAAAALAHGHLGAIYRPGAGFLAYPALLVLLAPLGAITFRGKFIEIAANHHLLAHPVVFYATSTNSLLIAQSPVFSGGGEYVLHPDVLIPLIPATLVLSCLALFACDALAERLQVSPSRRAVLGVAEAVALWNVTVFWGHPEDALAVGLAIYALIFAMDGRFTGAGWLFGAALAFQPLVLMMFPILLVMGGRNRAIGLIVRGAAPAAAVTIGPLVANFHDTVHTLLTQPTFPYNSENHQTPWTFVASRQGGTGNNVAVGAGPMRVVVLALAASVGWWARRWRERPEMVAWAVALALALRIYFEVAMTDYYVWPALAVGMVVAARCTRVRFGLAVATAVLTTIVAQWNLGWLPWWAIDVVGVTGLLVVASRPTPLARPAREARPGRPASAGGQGGSKPASAKKRRPPPRQRRPSGTR